MKRFLLPFFLCSIFLVSHASLPAEELPEFQVIVHLDNPVTSLTRAQVSKILLKTLSRWDDKSPVEPINLPRKSPVRESFAKQIHGRSVSSIESYWQRQIFSGRRVPPVELASDAEVLALVKENVRAIGYVSVAAATDGVKVVTLTD